MINNKVIKVNYIRDGFSKQNFQAEADFLMA